MLFNPPLVPARLIARYKRFLFDAELENGGIITGSCPNTGSMQGLTTPGSRIWLSEHDSPKRKYRHVFELIEADGTTVGVNTAMPNRLAAEAIALSQVSDLGDYTTARREQNYGRNSRIDLLLTDPLRTTTYVEVKNVHFMRQPGPCRVSRYGHSPWRQASRRTRRYGGSGIPCRHAVRDPAT